jgi:hypothetical protein
MAASPGPLGGLRGLVVLRSLLTNIGVTVLAEQLVIRGAGVAFEQGVLRDARQAQRAAGLGRELAGLVLKLHPA